MKKIIRFTAEWCPACQELSKMMLNTKTDLPIEVHDYDKDPQPFVEHKIKEIPTMLIVEDGVVLDKLVGCKFSDQELNKWMNPQ